MTETAYDISEPRRETPEPPHELTFKTDPDGRPLTAEMARGIIAVARTVRPGWTARAVAAALDEVRDQDPVAVTLALIAAAKNPNVTHPGVIVHSGVWWDSVDTFPPRPAPAPTVMPMMTRRERKERGVTSKLDDPALVALREKAAREAEERAARTGGYRVSEERMR